jgi:hypothetical protein
MFERTGWFGAAALALALAWMGTGCGPKPKDGGGTPPAESGAPGEGEPQLGTEGAPPAMTEGQPPAGTEGAPQPADGMKPAATEANTITIEVTSEERPTGSTPYVATAKIPGMEQAAGVPVKEGEVPGDLVDMLKKKREEMKTAGQAACVVVTSSKLDIPFDTVVVPVIKAVFRAGFQRPEVKYQPPAN